jgi:alpha-tubulin suppressor-like RCC1 family protein
MRRESNNKGSLGLFLRRLLLVFNICGKGLLVLVVLVFAAQLFLIGCGSTVNKTDKDAGGKAGNDRGPSDDAGPGGSGGAGGRSGSGGAGGTGGGGKTYSVGGTVTGLQGAGLRLRNNDGNYLSISADGSFTFPEELANGGSYSVTVGIQPSGTNRICTVENGTGKIEGAKIADIVVSCVEQPEGGVADTDWAKVSSGFDHSCAIKTNGTLFCWGDNSYGQLGNNSTTDSLVPMHENKAATDWINISAGAFHACAIKTDGTLFCWGWNEYGQLGNNSTTDNRVPVQESRTAIDWAEISAGYSHTCAIKNNGTLFCWGDNLYGKLGNNSTDNSSLPVQESTASTDWLKLSVGGSQTCAIKTNGTLFCWGWNEHGELGDNSTTNSPVPVQESTAATDWANLSAGYSHTCAIKTNGALFCWGRNESGQLGNNTTANSPAPVQVSTAATDWASLSAGGGHTCAIKTDGTIFCWGDNSSGQLGNNSFTDIHVPVQESTAATDWANLSAGCSHTCAIKTDGSLFCWGIGYDEGKPYVNNATLQYGPVPVQVSTAATD